MKSERGEIEVFLCPEDESSTGSSSSSGSSPSSRSNSGFPSPVNGARTRHHHRVRNNGNQMVGQFIDEDDGLLLETMDQNQQQLGATDIDADISSITASSEPFLCLEPPLDESDYTFTMDDNEGISNLFDFPF